VKAGDAYSYYWLQTIKVVWDTGTKMTDEFVWMGQKSVVAYSEVLYRHFPTSERNTKIFSCDHGNRTGIEPGTFRQLGCVYLRAKTVYCCRESGGFKKKWHLYKVTNTYLTEWCH
jgi:hypothetical protein